MKSAADLRTDETLPRSAMPRLTPVPIPTRGLPWYRAYWTWLTYRRDFDLGEDWHFRLPSGEDVMIPAGYRTDCASVPRILPVLAIVAVLLSVGLPLVGAVMALVALVVVLRLAPTDVLLIGGLCHDYAYQHQRLLGPDGSVAVHYPTRRSADSMFLEVNHVVNGLIVLDLICGVLLSCFGWIAWRRHRANDALKA